MHATNRVGMNKLILVAAILVISTGLNWVVTNDISTLNDMINHIAYNDMHICMIVICWNLPHYVI